MHYFRHLTATLCSAFLTLTCISAHADQVILKNGDTITGKVVSKSGKVLTFKTDYAGTLKITWDKVSTLATDQPVAALLKDDRYLNAKLKPAASGNVTLSQNDAQSDAKPSASDDASNGSANNNANDQPSTQPPAPVSNLDNILYINPTPEESGRGYQYAGHANLAVSDNSGNSVSQQTHADGEIQKRAKAYRYTLGGEFNNASDSNVNSVSNSRVYASYDSFYTPTDFLYVHGALENDKFTDIKLRTLGGVGYGYQIYNTDTTMLSIKGGPDLVNIVHYASPNENFIALGWHVSFNHKLSKFSAELFHTQDGYLGLNSDNDIMFKTRSGLRIPISGGLTATVQYNVDWEKNSVPGLGNTDRQLLIGIGYVF